MHLALLECPIHKQAGYSHSAQSFVRYGYKCDFTNHNFEPELERSSH